MLAPKLKIENFDMSNSGNLFIVSAPSGAGKTSLLKELVTNIKGISTSISTTTRPMRPGEIDGQDYHFVSIEEFISMKEQGDFLEHAEVFGNCYGTSKTLLQEILQTGEDLVLELDWQGAQQVREQMPDAISIFILPPSRKELAHRLTGRGQDDEQVIQKRMSSAITEISHYDEYDFLIINDIFDVALADLENVIMSHRLTLTKQSTHYKKLIEELL